MHEGHANYDWPRSRGSQAEDTASANHVMLAAVGRVSQASLPLPRNHPSNARKPGNGLWTRLVPLFCLSLVTVIAGDHLAALWLTATHPDSDRGSSSGDGGWQRQLLLLHHSLTRSQSVHGTAEQRHGGVTTGISGAAGDAGADASNGAVQLGRRWKAGAGWRPAVQEERAGRRREREEIAHAHRVGVIAAAVEKMEWLSRMSDTCSSRREEERERSSSACEERDAVVVAEVRGRESQRAKDGEHAWTCVGALNLTVISRCCIKIYNSWFASAIPFRAQHLSPMMGIPSIPALSFFMPSC